MSHSDNDVNLDELLACPAQIKEDGFAAALTHKLQPGRHYRLGVFSAAFLSWLLLFILFSSFQQTLTLVSKLKTTLGEMLEFEFSVSEMFASQIKPTTGDIEAILSQPFALVFVIIMGVVLLLSRQLQG